MQNIDENDRKALKKKQKRDQQEQIKQFIENKEKKSQAKKDVYE